MDNECDRNPIQTSAPLSHHVLRLTHHASRLRITFYASRFTHHVLRITFYASRFTPHVYASRFTHYALRITFYALYHPTVHYIRTLHFFVDFRHFFRIVSDFTAQAFRFKNRRVRSVAHDPALHFANSADR